MAAGALATGGGSGPARQKAAVSASGTQPRATVPHPCHDLLNRAELLALGSQGDPTAFINIATPTLGNHPDDSDLRILLVRRLAEEGLLERAARTVEGFPPELLARADFALLLRQLRETAQNGLIDWEALQGQYATNLDRLRSRCDWAGQMDMLWRAAEPHLELHQTRGGRWAVFDVRAGAAGNWRPCFGLPAPPQGVEQVAAVCKNKVLAPIVFDGIGFGEQLRVFHAATRDTLHGASPMLYVVEPELLAVAVVMHLHDFRAVIDDERVVFCVGPDAVELLGTELSRRSSVFPPQTLVASAHWDPRRQGQVRQVVEAAQGEAMRRCASIRTELARQCGGRDCAYWGARYEDALSGRAALLRVLGITSRFTTVLQYATRDALDALGELGCRTRLLIETDNYGHVTPQLVLETIRDFDPDLVFLVDHTRRTQQNSLIGDVPVMTWVQDRLPWLFDRAAGAAVGELDFVMGLGREELVGQYGYPADRFLSCEMATRAQSLVEDRADAEEAGADAREFDCDVAFATHASEPPEVLHAEFRGQWQTQIDAKFLDGLFEELRGRCERNELNGAIDFDYFVSRMCETLAARLHDEARRTLIAHHARPLVERLLRQQTIGWAANWARANGRRLHLYGRGWERHPQFAAYAKGVLPHGPVLGRAFRAARVNIHAGCNDALHQRVLDGVSAGGFFLIRRHAADVAYPIAMGLYEYVRQRGLRPPGRIPLNSLPPALRDGMLSLRRMKGVRLTEPIVLTEALLRRWEALRDDPDVLTASKLWPDFERITFGSEAELSDSLDRFIDDSAGRGEIAASMRKTVLQRFSYRALMGQMLRWMTARLAERRARAPLRWRR